MGGGGKLAATSGWGQDKEKWGKRDRGENKKRKLRKVKN